MAFLDNSGDIILDAVLTDTGRFRMAKGDGSFKIVKFALGDDEINYRLYENENNPSGVHASGSAYYDLSILQTPVFEAFTNNTSVMKYNLLSIPRTDILYLPVAKVNNVGVSGDNNGDENSVRNETLLIQLVAVDQDTEKSLVGQRGVLYGQNIGEGSKYCRVDFGLDTTDLPPAAQFDNSLRETQLMVQMDNRLGNLLHLPGVAQNISFLDDDQVATYFLINPIAPAVAVKPGGGKGDFVIAGPRQGSYKFMVQASLDLQSSTHLFTKFGSTVTLNAIDYRFIDTSVRVIGATMGYSVDVPIRYMKKV